MRNWIGCLLFSTSYMWLSFQSNSSVPIENPGSNSTAVESALSSSAQDPSNDFHSGLSYRLLTSLEWTALICCSILRLLDPSILGTVDQKSEIGAADSDKSTFRSSSRVPVRSLSPAVDRRSMQVRSQSVGRSGNSRGTFSTFCSPTHLLLAMISSADFLLLHYNTCRPKIILPTPIH